MSSEVRMRGSEVRMRGSEVRMRGSDVRMRGSEVRIRSIERKLILKLTNKQFPRNRAFIKPCKDPYLFVRGGVRVG